MLSSDLSLDLKCVFLERKLSIVHFLWGCLEEGSLTIINGVLYLTRLSA